MIRGYPYPSTVLSPGSTVTDTGAAPSSSPAALFTSAGESCLKMAATSR